MEGVAYGRRLALPDRPNKKVICCSCVVEPFTVRSIVRSMRHMVCGYLRAGVGVGVTHKATVGTIQRPLHNTIWGLKRAHAVCERSGVLTLALALSLSLPSYF